MRIYVAGSSVELERAERVMDALRLECFEITHDWTKDVRANTAAARTDADLTDHEAKAFASTDLRAIERAHLLLFLAPTTPTRGAWVELGYALALAGAPEGDLSSVYVSGPAARSSIFTRVADDVFASDDAAIAIIVERFGKRCGMCGGRPDHAHTDCLLEPRRR